MVFSSSLFLLYFFPLFLLIYHLAGHQRYKNYVLLIASIVFYSWGAPKFVFVLLASTIVDFYLVRTLHKSRTGKARKRWLILSLILNLGLLAYFKYANFFVENVNFLLHSLGFSQTGWVAVGLPIGISFYTFQTLTYSIDVYRRVHRPLDRLSDYLLYILSFPQMIAGPIVRFHSVADQIEEREERLDDKLLGLFRFVIGLAKKVLIANPLGEQADYILAHEAGEISFVTAWLGMFAYAFQIYFDFSGYSDMAIGIGRVMGFRFPENFDNPYTSRSITEFWKRWHITLSSWMRDYLYIPLGGNRVSRSRLYFNLWFVFLLSGLWHGASWNFVIWGAYHGLFLVMDRLFLLRLLEPMGKIPRMLLTFLIVTVGWVFFRIEHPQTAIAYLGSMAGISDAAPLYLPSSLYFYLSVAAFFSFITISGWGKRWEQEIFFRSRFSIPGYLTAFGVAGLLTVLSLAYITSMGYNPFIYFRF